LEVNLDAQGAGAIGQQTGITEYNDGVTGKPLQRGTITRRAQGNLRTYAGRFTRRDGNVHRSSSRMST
jgi:hypothetical protein